jgi:hypothetical protein
METTTALVRGAVGGALASAAMSGFMRTAQAAGLLDRLPPRIIVDTAVDAADAEETPGAVRGVAATLAHVGYGMACGVLFALGRRRLGRRGRSPLTGAAFGSLVWLVSYAGWLAALDILPPPQRDRPRRQLTMIAAHLVYGSVLGKIA